MPRKRDRTSFQVDMSSSPVSAVSKRQKGASPSAGAPDGYDDDVPRDVMMEIEAIINQVPEEERRHKIYWVVWIGKRTGIFTFLGGMSEREPPELRGHPDGVWYQTQDVKNSAYKSVENWEAAKRLLREKLAVELRQKRLPSPTQSSFSAPSSPELGVSCDEPPSQVTQVEDTIASQEQTPSPEAIPSSPEMDFLCHELLSQVEDTIASQRQPPSPEAIPSSPEMDVLCNELLDQVEDVIASQGQLPFPQATPSAPITSLPNDSEQPTKQETCPEFTLCEEQQMAMDLALQGHNLFITGSGGCGKSYLVEAIHKKLTALKKNVHLIAPTGRAAVNIGGRTTFTYAGWAARDVSKTDRDLIQKSRNRKTWLRLTQPNAVLVIDEISMVESGFFNRLSDNIGAVRRDAARRYDHQSPEQAEGPFGGMQIIVVGDFCQLPPVKPFLFCTVEVDYRRVCDKEKNTSRMVSYPCGKMEHSVKDGIYYCPRNETHGKFHEHDKWAFNSSTWKECDFRIVHLTRIHRQKDEEFVKALQNYRLGIRDEIGIDTLLKPRRVENAIRLYGTKRKVEAYNRGEMARLRGNSIRHHSVDHQINPQIKEDDHRYPRLLELKFGMPVVLVSNIDVEGGLCNGSQGTVCGFMPFIQKEHMPTMPSRRNYEDDEIGYQMAELRCAEITNFIGERTSISEADHNAEKKPPFPVVRFDNGKRRVIGPDCMVYEELTTQAPWMFSSRTQLPLVPGWAMTIHKSQSLTLDRVIIDLESIWDGRQAYVALSRARSLEGLKIIGYNYSRPKMKQQLLKLLPLDGAVKKYMDEVVAQAQKGV